MKLPFINQYFGSKKNALYWLQNYAYWRLGYYSQALDIDWRKVKRLIFVCKGNICRSAYAETYTNTRHPNIQTGSCGVQTTPGKPANPTAIKIACERNLSLEQHRTKSVSQLNFGPHDLILYVEPKHDLILQKSIKLDEQTQLSHLSIWNNKPPYLPDPYGMPEAYFHHCFEQIERSIDNIMLNIDSAANVE